VVEEVNVHVEANVVDEVNVHVESNVVEEVNIVTVPNVFPFEPDTEFVATSLRMTDRRPVRRAPRTPRRARRASRVARPARAATEDGPADPPPSRRPAARGARVEDVMRALGLGDASAPASLPRALSEDDVVELAARGGSRR
jgi:hypothetical protein